ncbi:MAG: cellulase family glycosylhydrolase, partial [Solirubrobacterales bacterium]
ALTIAASAPASVTGVCGGKCLVDRAAPQGPLSNAGRWITDARGRVVILHGLNMVYKRPPYRPGAVGFGADDAAFLRRNGFDSVRLGMIYKAVEPSPGSYDATYINRIHSTQRMLASHGIFSLLDFHQDLYSERYGGEGFPDWAVLDDGLPAEPLSGFPGSYLTSPGLNRAFDNLWANRDAPGGIPIQSRYAAAWARIARSFKGERGVAGYDLFNEPWPGSDLSTCLSTAGCPTFDTAKLAPFYRRVIARIRGIERRHLIFYEPNVLFNFDANTSLPDLGFKRLVFGFHDYCLVGLIKGVPSGCPAADQQVFDNADSHAKRTGDALDLSEFGATDDVATLQRLAGYSDRHMVSWQEWHYCGCDDPTTSGPGDTQALVKDPSRRPRGANVFHDKLKALARAYPQAIAGTPVRYSFDPATRRFDLVYTRDRVSGKGSFRQGVSTVFLPRIQYPRGYVVKVTGGSAVRGPSGRRLFVRPDLGSGQVHVTVTPAP